MKNVWIKILFLLILSYQAYGQLPLDQEAYVNRLQHELQNSADAYEKADKCYRLGEYYLYFDTVKTKEYLQEGLEYSKGNDFYQAAYLFYKARLTSLSNSNKAIQQLLEAQKAFEKIKTKEALLMRSKCWHDYARLLQQQDQPEAYTDILLNKAIPLAMAAGDSAYLGKNYLDLSFGFKNAGDYKKAEEYLKKSAWVLKDVKKEKQYLASTYHTLAEMYTLSGKPETAAFYLDSMKTLLMPYPKSLAWIDYYAGESMRLTVSGKYEESLATISRGVALTEKLGFEYEKQRLIMQKFYAYYEKGDFRGAKEVALALTQNGAFMSISTNRVQIYEGLALTYEHLKDYLNAYGWSQKYNALADSISKEATTAKINALEIKYQTNEKEKKIAHLEAEKLKNAYEIKTARLNNLLWASGCLLLLLAAALLIYILRNKKKLAIQKEINHQQQLKELEQKQQLALNEAILRGEEVERQRMARDLHDGLGGMISGLKMKLSGALQQDVLDRFLLQDIMEELGFSLSELRKIARNMMPESLTRFGFVVALNDLCKSLSNYDTEIHFDASGLQINMDPSRQIMIYRIIQEALSNAIKHAQAKNIWLQCRQNEHTISISIEDDGKGFDMDAVSNKDGIGLSNIRNRVSYLNGKMDINSSPMEGTVLIIELGLVKASA